MNITAVRSMAIITAFHQLNYCPDSSFEECWSDEFFIDILDQTLANLSWAKLATMPTVNEYDIANAIWAMDEDQFVEALMELEE